MSELPDRDGSRTLFINRIIDQLGQGELSVRFAALRIIDKLVSEDRFLEKLIEGSIVEPFLRVLDMELKMYQDDVLNVVFPAKNICLKVLQELIEREENDDLKVIFS